MFLELKEVPTLGWMGHSTRCLSLVDTLIMATDNISGGSRRNSSEFMNGASLQCTSLQTMDMSVVCQL